MLQVWLFDYPSKMEVFLIDGTYELFRHYFAHPKMLDSEGREVGAVRGVLSASLGEAAFERKKAGIL